jgi:hypothetical protein
MAIQKKSLISNRAATRKALVAKPEVSNKPGMTRLKGLKVAATKVTATRVAATKVAATRIRGLQ